MKQRGMKEDNKLSKSQIIYPNHHLNISTGFLQRDYEQNSSISLNKTPQRFQNSTRGADHSPIYPKE